MSAGKATRVIDLHAHAVLEAGFNQAGACGPEAGVEDGVPYFRIGSYRMAELVARHPGKFLGAAALPMQDVDAAPRTRTTPGSAVST